MFLLHLHCIHHYFLLLSVFFYSCNNISFNLTFQADLGIIMQVTAVATQGSTLESSWVTSYYLAFSTDGQVFQRYGGNVTSYTRDTAVTEYTSSVVHTFVSESLFKVLFYILLLCFSFLWKNVSAVVSLFCCHKYAKLCFSIDLSP